MRDDDRRLVADTCGLDPLKAGVGQKHGGA